MNAASGPRRRAVTIREVAEAAGVSTATVSLVVNNKEGARIGDSTRRRVQKAVADLGYRPNALAKDLASFRSRFIGLVADAIATTPFAGQIIHGAQDEAWRHGYVLLVANTEDNEDTERDAIAMMLEHKVRGIVYSTWYHREVNVPRELVETDCVLVNCFANADLPTVVPDEAVGGHDATAMLLERGHRRVAFLNTVTPSPAHDERFEGYCRALDEAGLDYDPALVIDVQPDAEGGYNAVTALLDLEVTGVFCHNDRVAMGLYDGLRERGISIPEDISVVGFDNQDVIAAHLRPPLSTVALPHYDLGAAGVRVLLGLETVGTDGRLMIACPPVPRNSIAPPEADVKPPRAARRR